LISAERSVSASPERVFEFLSDLRNHWRLEDQAFVGLEELDKFGGIIGLRGPFGLSRKVRTRVLESVPFTRVAGRADLSGGTVGLVAWEIRPEATGSTVRLSAEVAAASLSDRVFLLVIGRRWFRELFERTLANLESAL
jgi:uncharacterized protein YndB with AHSA1/START domain